MFSDQIRLGSDECDGVSERVGALLTRRIDIRRCKLRRSLLNQMKSISYAARVAARRIDQT
jgi:hypothetical protein